ncbi:MAG: TonB-dependent receptor [Sphingobacteriales bacterium]|nr:MAG: TonB-dependent receptor [Sphingobacteriales bacterium]
MAGHLDFNFGTKKFASLTSVSYSDFGDLRKGDIRNPMYGDWGKRNYYAMWTGTGDSMVKNDDPNVQVGTGYTQYDVMEKLLFKQNDHVSHLLNFQFSTTTDVPRYDRLSEIGGNGNLSNGEWYYGPQKRLLGSYNLGLKAEKGLYDNANIILAYQDVEESRHKRDFNLEKLTNRNEHVTVMSLNADFEKGFTSHELRYGLEAVMNSVESTADFVKLISGDVGIADTRFPDGGSSTRSIAAYLTHNWEIGKKMVFSQGLRFTNNNLQSTFNDTLLNFPYSEITQTSSAITGNIGLVFKPCESWNISLLFSNGFRTPNVDDIAKVFESVGGDALIVPNPLLKPEQLYNTELTIAKSFNKTVRVEATAWYAMYKNAITTDYATFNGSDSILYEGSMKVVKSSVNKGEAFVYGATGGLYADVTKNLIVYSTVTYTYGRIKTDTVDYPLDHIPPMFGKTGMQLNLKKFSGEAFAMYNGAKAKKDYNLLGEDNQLYSLDPVDGYNPAWITVNARVGYQVNKILQLQVSVENILDQNYRYFASGLSAPGRNLIATLRARF